MSVLLLENVYDFFIVYSVILYILSYICYPLVCLLSLFEIRVLWDFCLEIVSRQNVADAAYGVSERVYFGATSNRWCL